MTKTEQKLSPAQKMEQTILAMSNKDIASKARGENSYFLWNWMREELIGREIHKQQKFVLTAIGFSRVSYILASLRERGELAKLKVEILDTQTINIEAHFDLGVLDNRMRYILNAQYGWNLELLVDEAQPEDDFNNHSWN